ncbi:UEV domain-containing protein [Colletotrichum sojae]|uniref:UEV domain-containing protein n=1 Tax=Colletotrichum sojae TaxID=2175907 RepID=A0A8H6N4U8_9PEZI|nr:UEV domain-containing protein [Colletotrichum sojae]
MAVPQHVLNWLYSVLTSEYHDVNRTYNDVAQALSQYPSLSPRTDVHTFDNGSSALLLHLSGTIPVIFRGTTYRFPISLWVPHCYPREAPLVYVTPTDSMVVRPGQHVDPQGQVYHPYLVGWSAFWDKSTILDFLAILRDIFAKEPPVIARPQERRQSPASTSPAPRQIHVPPPVPPLRPDLAPRLDIQPSNQGPVDAPRPPPPPPKTSSTVSPYQNPPIIADVRSETPFPPLHPDINDMGRRIDHGVETSLHPQSQNYCRYDSAPPLPMTDVPPASRQPSVMSSLSVREFQTPPLQHVRPEAALRPSSSTASHRYASAAPLPQKDVNSYGSPLPGWLPDPRRFQGLPPHQHQLQHRQPPSLPQGRKPAPPPDLLDGPLTLRIPSPSSVHPPPIPPNPEKDALLHQLGQTLSSLRQRSRQQNESSMAGLQAQRSAMLNAFSTLQSEMGSLSQTSALLQSNANILVGALRKADTVIDGSTRQRAPDIDELLVAPTVVSNQLYNLVAEEKAIGDTVFVLGRAVERGRISPAVFAKTTRSLAREWYLKKALVRKIGKGMGLAT